MIKIPAMISIFEICFLLIIGSKIAVKSVMDDRQTSVTGTVDSLIEAKKRIQWPPTKAPVNTNFRAVFALTLNAVLLNLKYKNSEILAINTLYQTKFTAEMEINWPKIPVKPQIKTVKWRIKRFLLTPELGFKTLFFDSETFFFDSKTFFFWPRNACFWWVIWVLTGHYLGALMMRIYPIVPKTRLGIITAMRGGKPPLMAKTSANLFTTM